jgi:predicted amidophosphoribosyltransferase
MTTQEFITRFGVEKINLFNVDGHLYLYTKPIYVKLDVNKNIVREDLKEESRLSIVNYLDGYVMTKDGTIQPYGIKLDGHWKAGFALDYHTISSTPIGDYGDGRTIFDTIRPPIAEELYKLKYCKEQTRIEKIARPAADFLNKYKTEWQLDLIIPVPPSDTTRNFQPVYEMSKSIGRLVGLPVDYNILKKVKSTFQLKGIHDPDTRREILKDAFSINFNALGGKNVLIFDDIYRSGETINAVCDVIMNKGKARGVYVLTITKTRTKK